MNKKDKREIYGALTATFGSPLKMSSRKRRRLLILLGGWIGQNDIPAVRYGYFRDFDLQSRPVRFEPDIKNLFERAAEKVTGPSPNWHWNIHHRIKIPKTKSFQPKYEDPGRYTRGDWNWIEKQYAKGVAIALPVNYNMAVCEDIRVIGKRIVQRVWNRRTYSDKDTWECSFWDFSALNKDEESWRNAVWSEGFVVRMATGMAVETTLTRALSMARSRTIKAGIKSVLRDHDGTG